VSINLSYNNKPRKLLEIKREESLKVNMIQIKVKDKRYKLMLKKVNKSKINNLIKMINQESKGNSVKNKGLRPQIRLKKLILFQMQLTKQGSLENQI
jgi:hypothetical protein